MEDSTDIKIYGKLRNKLIDNRLADADQIYDPSFYNPATDKTADYQDNINKLIPKQYNSKNKTWNNVWVGTQQEYNDLTQTSSDTSYLLDANSSAASVNIVIITDNGNVLYNNQGTTTLTALVYQGYVDITNLFEPIDFSWERTSSTGIDESWNSQHIGCGNQIVVDAEDVYNKSVFTCIVNISKLYK